MKKILKWALLVVIGFYLLIATLVTIENWRGKRAWEKKVAEMRESGEPMTLEEIRGSLPAEEDNFATFFKPFLKMSDGNYSDQNKAEEIKALSNKVKKSRTPLPSHSRVNKGQKIDLQSWADYYRQGDEALKGVNLSDVDVVLEYQKKFIPILDEFCQASARPAYCSLIDPSKTFIEQDVMYIMPIKSLMEVLSLHALVLIHKGNKKQAYEYTLAGLRAVNHLQNDIFLMTHLVNQSIFRNIIQPYWEGLDKHFWTDAQLLEFQKTLAKINFIKANQKALKGERALAMFLTQLRGTDFMPKAVFYRNGIALLEMHDEFSPKFDILDEQFTFSELNILRGHKSEPDMMTTKNPYRMWAVLSHPAFSGSYGKSAMTQILRDEALVSVYLERYYLKHKEYPESLEQLVPEFVAAVPVDRYDGKPLRYQRLGKASYRLYSVGPNLKDDGGVRGQDKAHADGDLVWEVGVN
ncbi:hypothetical protein QQ056_16130 [Oscillatoria laete-virens NRMC-F 0139]|nr:hypothetical protein [Oscillatoria laete-virens NRMC-F 0139]